MTRKYATADTVGIDELVDFVRPRHHMVLTTFRADGSLQTSPVTGGVDEQGRIVIASYPQRAKAANLRRTPRASVTVLSPKYFCQKIFAAAGPIISVMVSLISRGELA